MHDSPPIKVYVSVNADFGEDGRRMHINRQVKYVNNRIMKKQGRPWPFPDLIRKCKFAREFCTR